MTATEARAGDSPTRASAPPFRPDPAIMGNIEGNRKILEHDRRAAQRFLDEQDAASQRGEPVTEITQGE